MVDVITLQQLLHKLQRIGDSIARSADAAEVQEFTYKNWKGEVAQRRAYFRRLVYGSTSYHNDKQWLVDAWDVDKSVERTFAVADIVFDKGS